MPDLPVSISIPEPLASLLEEEALKKGEDDPVNLIMEILSSYFAHRRGDVLQKERCDQEEYLKLRIENLRAALKKKDQEISALLEMWHIRLGKEVETLTPGEKRLMEEKIVEIQRDWYSDAERQDFSGAGPSERSLSSSRGSRGTERTRPDQEA